MRQHFWAGGAYLGYRDSAPERLRDRDNQYWLTGNIAYCCPYCGELWGRVTVDQPDRVWTFRSRPCRHCPPGYFHFPLIGTLGDLPSWTNDSAVADIADWPEGAVRWEFQSLLLSFERLANG